MKGAVSTPPAFEEDNGFWNFASNPNLIHFLEFAIANKFREKASTVEEKLEKLAKLEQSFELLDTILNPNIAFPAKSKDSDREKVESAIEDY